MARIPDRFDLWVRKARECGDPVRRVDLVLGSLVALGDWYFFNQGSKQKPQVAEVEMEQGRYVLVFSDAGRIGEMLDEAGRGRDGEKVIARQLRHTDAHWETRCRRAEIVRPNYP